MTTDVEFMEKPVDVKALLNKIRKLSKKESQLILIIEDDKLSRDLLVQALNKHSWQTIEAEDGKKALDMLEKAEPTLILLDLMLPEVDGFQLLKEIQKHAAWKKIPVIVITAKALTNKERIFLNRHTQDLFLKKAYSFKNFIAALIDRIRRGKR